MKINVPKLMLDQEEIKTLNPLEREKYVRSLIKNILSVNNNGVMVSEIVDATALNRITVTKHLEYLVAIREAYKSDRGTGAIYYQNGRLVHQTDRMIIPIGNKIYEFVKLENADGNFVFIQEKEEDEMKAKTVKGGIMIRVEDLFTFLNGLKDFVKILANKLEVEQ